MNIPEMISQLKGSRDKSYQMQAESLLFQYSFWLNALHHYEEALDAIKQSKEKTFQYYFVKGKAYTNQHNSDKATEKRSKASEKLPFTPIYFLNAPKLLLQKMSIVRLYLIFRKKKDEL